MESPEVRKALILAQSIGQAEQLQRHLAGKPYHDIEFRYPASISHQVQDLQTVFRDCCATIQDEDIDVVINVDPGLNFVQAALAEKFQHLITPSLDSLLFCCHQFYNKQKITNEFCDEHWLVDFEDDVTQQAEKIFASTEQPYLLFNGAFKNIQPVKKIHSVNSFMRDLDVLNKRMKTDEKVQRFLRGRIQEDTFYYAFHKCAVLQVDSSRDAKRTSNHMIEACVSNGEIVPWVISDLHFWKCNRNIPKSSSIPTKLTEIVQYEVWAVFRLVVQKLINNGFDNHFVQARITVQDDTYVKIMDMDSGIIKENTLTYRHVFTNGDNLGALIDLGLNRLMNHPKLLPSRAAVRAQLIIFRSDPEPVSISDVADMAYAKHHPGVILHVHDHSTIVHDKRRGFHLADIIALGATVEECELMVEDISRKILKDRRSSHWTHCLHK